uniref:Uncharacterized protein n=1 Tax=Globodera rostochiensis TaxID=31243 RepID=A0A914HQP1_GLORO
MEEFWILILFAFFIATNLMDKAESVKLELKTFDEIFGEGWWDKGEAEDLKTPAPKDKNPEIRDEDIAKMLKIGTTLYKWKKQFHPNSVDGHSVEENAATNVQEIVNSNLGSI